MTDQYMTIPVSEFERLHGERRAWEVQASEQYMRADKLSKECEMWQALAAQRETRTPITLDDIERMEKINELLVDGFAGEAGVQLGEFLDDLQARARPHG